MSQRFFFNFFLTHKSTSVFKNILQVAGRIQFNGNRIVFSFLQIDKLISKWDRDNVHYGIFVDSILFHNTFLIRIASSTRIRTVRTSITTKAHIWDVTSRRTVCHITGNICQNSWYFWTNFRSSIDFNSKWIVRRFTYPIAMKLP